MSEYHTVANADEIPEGEGRAFQIGGQTVAVFRSDGRFYAIEDRCPHAGAPLSCGSLVDGTVVCGWHAWRFRLSDGAWVENPKLGINTYPVRLHEGKVQVEL